MTIIKTIVLASQKGEGSPLVLIDSGPQASPAAWRNERERKASTLAFAHSSMKNNTGKQGVIAQGDLPSSAPRQASSNPSLASSGRSI